MSLNDLTVFYTRMVELGIVKAELVSDEKKLVGFQATYIDGSIVQHNFDAIVVKEAEIPEEKKEEPQDVKT